jgi:hypothetical protein
MDFETLNNLKTFMKVIENGSGGNLYEKNYKCPV